MTTIAKIAIYTVFFNFFMICLYVNSILTFGPMSPFRHLLVCYFVLDCDSSIVVWDKGFVVVL
jgi:hypothetical protein